MTIKLTGNELTIDEVASCARSHESVQIASEPLKRIEATRNELERRIAEGERIYGINTGLGALANITLPNEAITDMQRNQILSHAFGVGDELDEDEARAIMIIRLNSLLNGNSGVRPRIVKMLCDMLNSGIYPRIPRKGSAGASGDLAPLAHMALVMIGEGEVKHEGEWRPAPEVLETKDIEPVTFLGKEGVAIVNSTNFMAALGALAIYDARTIVETADVVGAMSLESLRGISDAFHPEIHELRNQPGQKDSAAKIRESIHGSELVRSSEDSGEVQDSYSLRCMPQVHGASRDVISWASDIIEREINAVTDNPLVVESGDVVSGGNFHGQPIAFALDFLGCALAELGNISERRIFKIVAGEEDDAPNALPPFLVQGDVPGVNSGFMIPQVTAAALVSETKTLTHPASTDSIPTSDNQEDHVSMGANGANQLVEIKDNVLTVLAIELYTAYQSLSFRERDPGETTQAIQNLLSSHFEPLEEDRYMIDDFHIVRDMIIEGRIATK